MSSIVASAAVEAVARAVTGLPAFIAGSSVAALKHDHISDLAFDDVDVFFATEAAIIAAVSRLQAQGFVIDKRHVRVYERWLKMGMGRWHTHSLKLIKEESTFDISGDIVMGELKVNLVLKKVDGHATTSLSQVIESFDFGLLHWGFDCELMEYRDMGSYLYPSIKGDLTAQPLPMIPLRAHNWERGLFSQYQGMREVGRYLKYQDYGYDMSLVLPTLTKGYWLAGEYHTERTDDPSKVALGNIYLSLAESFETENIDRLRAFAREIVVLDDLDAIMEAVDNG